jgi:hypothetical protein
MRALKHVLQGFFIARLYEVNGVTGFCILKIYVLFL